MNSPPSNNNWITQLHEELFPQANQPFLGSVPPFPWDTLSATLAETFQLPNLKLQPTQAQWTVANELTQSFGEDPTIFTFNLAPLNGELYWILCQEDFQQISHWILAQTNQASPYIDDAIRTGLQNFFAITLLSQCQNLPYLEGLSPSLKKSSPPPQETSFCIDFQAQWQDKTINNRLIINNSLRNEWFHYLKNKTSNTTSPSFSPSLQVPVHINVAETTLTETTLNSLSEGDLLLLPNCPLNPQTMQGPIFATSHGLHCFKALLNTDGKLEITELTP